MKGASFATLQGKKDSHHWIIPLVWVFQELCMINQSFVVILVAMTMNDSTGIGEIHLIRIILKIQRAFGLAMAKEKKIMAFMQM